MQLLFNTFKAKLCCKTYYAFCAECQAAFQNIFHFFFLPKVPFETLSSCKHVLKHERGMQKSLIDFFSSGNITVT